MLDKNTNAIIFKLLSAVYFSKYEHCDMRFLVEKNSELLCFLEGFGIAVPEISY